MIELRSYQENLIERLRAALKKTRHVLLQSPTGTGKTAIASYMIKNSVEKGRSTVFQVHRKELVKQVSTTLDKIGVPHSYIAAGYPYDARALCHIAIVNTLHNRREKILPPDFLIIDEAHMSASESWSRVVDWAKAGESFIVGLTATPVRFDGKGLGKHFSMMVEADSIESFIQQGFLSKYRYFAPTKLTAKFRVKHGDYDINEVEEAMMTPKLIGDVVSNWQKYALGKRTIIFAPTIKASLEIVRSFNEAGFPAIHLDSKMGSQARQAAISGFANGDYTLLSNVAIMIEGFDLSTYADKDVPIEACILYTATISTSRYLQMVGRALRPKVEPAIIIDHGNNCDVHGMPNENRDWSLDDKPKGNKKPKSDEPRVSTCPDCYHAHEPAPACPECGHIYETKEREIKKGSGELIERTGAAVNIDFGKLERQARAKYRQTAIEKGYKPGWVFYRMEAWRKKYGGGKRNTEKSAPSLIEDRSETSSE